MCSCTRWFRRHMSIHSCMGYCHIRWCLTTERHKQMVLYLMLQNYNLYIWIIIEECQIFRNVSPVYTGTINFLFSSRLRQTLKHINSLARDIHKGALVRHTVSHLTPLYPALQLQLYPLMSSLHYNSSTIKTLHFPFVLMSSQYSQIYTNHLV